MHNRLNIPYPERLNCSYVGLGVSGSGQLEVRGQPLAGALVIPSRHELAKVNTLEISGVAGRFARRLCQFVRHHVIAMQRSTLTVTTHSLKIGGRTSRLGIGVMCISGSLSRYLSGTVPQ